MIQIPHFGADFLSQNTGSKTYFIFAKLKLQGTRKKKKINKSNFIFIPVLEKLGTGDFINEKIKNMMA